MQSNEQRETLILQTPMLGTFGSKLTFTVGATYMAFGIIGFCYGAYKIKPPLVNFPNRKLLGSYYFNNMMSCGLRFANNAGGAAFLYSLTGFLMTRTFEDEFDFLSPFQKNTVAGILTGALYKCTKGFRVAGQGALVGGVLMGGVTYLTDHLREKELTDFELRFDE